MVDDEEGILKLVSEVLQAGNYQVEVASHGEAALLKTTENRYDVIVCDWKMPGITGRQVFEHLCIFNPEATQRFIFMTGDVINDTTREFLQQHSRPCLSKPFSLTDLTTAIAEVVAG